MKKLKRNERIGGLMQILTERPNHIFTYNYFTERFNAAKSTISEDMMIAKEMVEKLELGYIDTISGASGGVRFIPKPSKGDTKVFLEGLCENLSSKDRLITGDFIYMTDILYSPNIAASIGKIFASQYITRNIDSVVTVETKGIPIALMTANYLNVPLIIIRKNARVTEGPTVSINYVSGSSKKIQTMSLSRRAVTEGSRVLVIDDFMKAGGTAKGIEDLMLEFKAHVVGMGVLISTKEPMKKLVEDYTSLLILEDIDKDKNLLKVESNHMLFE